MWSCSSSGCPIKDFDVADRLVELQLQFDHVVLCREHPVHQVCCNQRLNSLLRFILDHVVELLHQLPQVVYHAQQNHANGGYRKEDHLLYFEFLF